MESGSRNDARIRGNAQQLLEKYKSLARDAAAAGDRIQAEYYMQYADHYYRVLAEFRSRYEDTRARERDDRDHDDLNYEDDNSDVPLPQAYTTPVAAPVAQPSLNLEQSAEAPAAEDAPAAVEAEPAAEAAEAPAEEEKPRRRRGRPRKVKVDAEAEESAA